MYKEKKNFIQILSTNKSNVTPILQVRCIRLQGWKIPSHPDRFNGNHLNWKTFGYIKGSQIDEKSFVTAHALSKLFYQNRIKAVIREYLASLYSIQTETTQNYALEYITQNKRKENQKPLWHYNYYVLQTL